MGYHSSWWIDCLTVDLIGDLCYTRHMDLNMKLIRRHIQQNPETFAPEMEIVITMPLEFAVGALCSTEAEFEAKLGKDLIALLRTKDE